MGPRITAAPLPPAPGTPALEFTHPKLMQATPRWNTGTSSFKSGNLGLTRRATSSGCNVSKTRHAVAEPIKSDQTENVKLPLGGENQPPGQESGVGGPFVRLKCRQVLAEVTTKASQQREVRKVKIENRKKCTRGVIGCLN